MKTRFVKPSNEQIISLYISSVQIQKFFNCPLEPFIIVWFTKAVSFWPARPIYVNKRITDRHIGAVMGRKKQKIRIIMVGI